MKRYRGIAFVPVGASDFVASAAGKNALPAARRTYKAVVEGAPGVPLHEQELKVAIDKILGPRQIDEPADDE